MSPAVYLPILVFVALVILAYLYRVLAGPTVFDRLLGLNGISTKSIILQVLIGSIYGRLDMFIDIAVGYALLNLVGALALSKYLEQRGP